MFSCLNWCRDLLHMISNCWLSTEWFTEKKSNLFKLKMWFLSIYCSSDFPEKKSIPMLIVYLIFMDWILVKHVYPQHWKQRICFHFSAWFSASKILILLPNIKHDLLDWLCRIDVFIHATCNFEHGSTTLWKTEFTWTKIKTQTAALMLSCASSLFGHVLCWTQFWT